MTTETTRTFEDYKVAINGIRERGREFWTNIVGCELAQAAQFLGKDEANRLIRECDLEDDGWQQES